VLECTRTHQRTNEWNSNRLCFCWFVWENPTTTTTTTAAAAAAATTMASSSTPTSPLITPTTEGQCPFQHHCTPQKAKIQGTIEYLQAKGITGQKEAVFRHFGVPARTGYRLLTTGSRRHHNDMFIPEKRGRKSIITEEQLRRMERIVEEYGFDGRALTWLQLGHEAGVEASWRTIQRAMGTLNYRKCIACKKG
jgi:hypothetical protein